MPPQVVGRHHHLGTQMPSGGVHPITAPLGPAECVVHLGRSYPREDPSCSGLVPTAKTTLNPAHVRPERRALQNEPRLDDTITAAGASTGMSYNVRSHSRCVGGFLIPPCRSGAATEPAPKSPLGFVPRPS